MYSVSVTNTDGVSSSYGISSEGRIFTKASTNLCLQLFTVESTKLFNDVSELCCEILTEVYSLRIKMKLNPS